MLTCDIDTLTKWFKKRGYRVSFPANATSSVQGKSVNINYNLSPQRKVHVMLHEAGHVLIMKRKSWRFSLSYGFIPKDKVTSLWHAADVLDEENEAWLAGLRLAKRLDIHVDMIEYMKDRARALSTYTLWASGIKLGITGCI